MRPTRILIAALALAAAPPALAADEPEAVYGKFHRAAASGNLDEMVRYTPDVQRADIARMSAAQREAQTKMLAAMMPRAFLLRKKLANKDGSATLIVSGPAENPNDGRLETVYGTVKMVLERGEWKVEETRWSSEQPGILAAERAAGAAAKDTAAGKAPPRGSAPVVGSMEAAPARKLGTQKPPCVYKPVMTAEDLENCK